MAGLYLHIPYCRQACHYCNFHFSTSLKDNNGLIGAILQEARIRAPEITESIDTVYFGGGTPSLLNKDQLSKLFDCIANLFHVSEDAEITLEANPDDLTKNYLAQLASTPVNRLSIGIQSFRDEDLQWMNRAHNAKEASTCIAYARDAGFEALSLDLIYGSPGLTDEAWLENIEKAVSFKPDHLSCYALTVEEGTALHHFIKSGKTAPVDPTLAGNQFMLLMQQVPNYGFEQYEISNFCRDKKYARHNTAYWQGVPYLGLGPSAHSFDGTSRSWNVAHNHQYQTAIQAGELPLSKEELSLQDQFNEMVMTGLRTKWGVSLKAIEEKFGAKQRNQFESECASFVKQGLMQISQQAVLTMEGKLMADRIASDLFLV